MTDRVMNELLQAEIEDMKRLSIERHKERKGVPKEESQSEPRAGVVPKGVAAPAFAEEADHD